MKKNCLQSYITGEIGSCRICLRGYYLNEFGKCTTEKECDSKVEISCKYNGPVVCNMGFVPHQNADGVRSCQVPASIPIKSAQDTSDGAPDPVMTPSNSAQGESAVG